METLVLLDKPPGRGLGGQRRTRGVGRGPANVRSAESRAHRARLPP